MTTVAFRDGIMACDTMGTWGGDVSYGFTKIGRTKTYLVGFVGSFVYIPAVYEWVRGLDMSGKGLSPVDFYKYKDCLPPDIDDVTAILARRDGKMWALLGSGFSCPIHGSYEAIGSGGRVALGAMHAGANVVQAVEASIRHDDGTGGEVKYFGFDCEPFSPFDD